MAELEGKKLDRYELRKLIGKGGMANVYEAFDPKINRVVAIKVFKREDEEMLRRFLREAELMAGLHHSHLIEVYDSGEAPIDGIARSYIVMPLMTGGTLRLRIRRSPLSLAEICQCLRDISGALDYIHSLGIIHRDIKASNVLLNEEGRCYLTDFGIARVSDDATQLTSTGNVLGTVDYVAPELFEIHKRADALSDLYSLGVLLYEMVTGRLPFSADNQLALISMHVSKLPPSPRQFVPQLSREVEQVINKALEKKPERRYQSAAELTEAFCRAVNKSGINVPDASAVKLAQAAKATVVASANSQSNLTALPVAGKASPLESKTEGFFLTEPAIAHFEQIQETPAPIPILPSHVEQKPRRQRSIIVAIIALLTVLIVVVPVFFAIKNITTNHTHPGGTTQTAASGQTPASTTQSSPTINLTGTAGAVATATAVVAPTVTAQAQASATAGPIQTVTAGQPVYQDTLNDANNSITQSANWDQSNQCLFAGDGYHVKQSASFPYFQGCREQNNTYTNLALTVTVTLLGGHSGGIFFRLTTNLLNNYDGYLFEIDSQGHYKISRQQGTATLTLLDWSKDANPALRSGYNIRNTLQLIANGNTFQFYANGRFLAQVQNSYATNGALGFLATSVAGGNDADVVYSNLKVYNL